MQKPQCIRVIDEIGNKYDVPWASTSGFTVPAVNDTIIYNETPATVKERTFDYVELKESTELLVTLNVVNKKPKY